ncbi:MAG: hypothetical protein K6E91_09080, partial [Butyrivibrio sp.]|nr:hypothetical protein [Butyrivibrio sp.]
MKKMILYQPLYIDNRTDSNSGTLVRPIQMKRAFESIGYHVISINGSTKHRKAMLHDALKDPELEFMYIESANVPMCLSNKDHIPVAPFSDINNFILAKKTIGLGLFYRDAFWRYPSFTAEVGILKSLVLKSLFYIEFCCLK